MQESLTQYHQWVKYNDAVARLKREYPQLENILQEPPCEYCFEVFNVNGHCDSTVCPKLDAWLIAATKENWRRV